MRVTVKFLWFDMWVGVFVDRARMRETARAAHVAADGLPFDVVTYERHP